jgi:UrcA family protein
MVVVQKCRRSITMKRLCKIVTLAACAVVLSALSATAGETARSGIPVSYKDLDLSQRTGAQVLIGRLEAAASKACGEAPYIGDLKGLTVYRNCVKDAMDRAIAKVDQPVVSALYGQPLRQLAASK